MDDNANKVPLMSTTNATFPMPFNKLVYQTAMHAGPSVASSESQSDISSIGSDWSDVNAIALQLGITDPNDVKNDRFKVDRQKLENMIKTESASEGVNGAAHFFETVMKLTSTYISWPCHLKIGAKTRKDPHVRIVGRADNVTKAKEKVLASLDSRGSRVIMKMDISYTDHSYIIGRGGKNIKRIMDGTKTHIHFPDSNRSNPTEKSNQVSLCGSLDGVEKARSLIRLSTPLIISFELPIMMPGRPVPDNDTQYVKEIETKFNIQVIFSTRSKLHSSLVLVKGSEKEASKVQEATQLLINFMCDSIATQINFNLQLEISPHHHDIVKGNNNSQLLNIMEKTKTKIIFPDVNDVNTKTIKKSQVIITGAIDGVYKARQQLIGNLPVALIFDYPDTSVHPNDITMLGNKYGVFIALRQKTRQSTVCVVIKGVEKYVDKVYEARHVLLNLSSPLVEPDIPATYFTPKEPAGEMAYRNSLAALLANYPESPLTPGIPANYDANNSLFNQLKNSNESGQMNMANMGTHLTPAVLNRYQIQQYPQHQQQLQHHQQQQDSKLLQSFSMWPPVSPGPRSCGGNTSGYNSSFTNSNNSLEQTYAPYQQHQMQTSSSRYSPEPSGKILSTSSNCRSNDFSGSSGTPIYDNDSARGYSPFKNMFLSEYNVKRLEGVQAMKDLKYTDQGLRVPTSNWQGLSLSKSSPVAMDARHPAHWTHRDESSVLGITTSIIDSTPVDDRLQLVHFKDVPSMLTHLKLEHYIDNFMVEKIDIERFQNLTDENLVNIGVKALGARKKLLLAIHQLRNQYDILRQQSLRRFSGSAAPGAERRPSTFW